jgi:hypothetical protein
VNPDLWLQVRQLWRHALAGGAVAVIAWHVLPAGPLRLLVTLAIVVVVGIAAEQALDI